MVDRGDIEIDIDINDFADFYICEFLNEHLGENVNSNPYDLAKYLTSDIAANGTLNNSKESAQYFIKNHLKNVYLQVKYELEEFGQVFNDPFVDPEAFQVGMLISCIEKRLATSEYLCNAKKVVYLDEDTCREIKNSVGISVERGTYLENLYNPDPNLFTLEAFRRDLDTSLSEVLGYADYLEKGYLDVDPDVKNLIVNTCHDLGFVGSNYISGYTKHQCDAAAKSIKKDIFENAKSNEAKKEIAGDKRQNFHAVACR